jgi:hypothetical protein
MSSKEETKRREATLPQNLNKSLRRVSSRLIRNPREAAEVEPLLRPAHSPLNLCIRLREMMRMNGLLWSNSTPNFSRKRRSFRE